MDRGFDENREMERKVAFTKTYDDVPLSFARKEDPIPEKILQMQKIYDPVDVRRDAREYYFYTQGKFMEDYTDDYTGRAQMTRYFPTYHSMNPSQLRFYFTWRTNLRKREQDEEKAGSVTPWTTEEVLQQRFLIGLYLDELIGNIGCTREEGCRKLEALKVRAGADELLAKRIGQAMQDYRIYYGIREEKTEDMTLPRAVHVLEVFENYLSGKAKELPFDEMTIFRALCKGSGYPFGNPAKKDIPLLAHVCAQCFGQVSGYYTGHGMRSLTEQFFGRKGSRLYFLFEDEVFYDHLHYQDYTFALDEDDIFTCTNGTWHKLSHAWNYRDSSALATLCHEIDRQFRDAFHTKSPLKDAGIDSAVESLITGVIASVLEERKKAAYEAAHPKVEIDFARLSGIRSDAEHTFNQLNVDGEAEDFVSAPAKAPVPAPEPSPAVSPAPVLTPVSSPAPSPVREERKEPSDTVPASSVTLTDIQKTFLSLVLRGEDAEGYARECHQMLSVLVDGINEAFYDEIGDSVLEEDDGKVNLIEDYREDVEGYLGSDT